jgi:hypothetical protein
MGVKTLGKTEGFRDRFCEFHTLKGPRWWEGKTLLLGSWGSVGERGAELHKPKEVGPA